MRDVIETTVGSQLYCVDEMAVSQQDSCLDLEGFTLVMCVHVLRRSH